MKISVFITSYNQKDFLVEAIESVLAQTLQPFEIIIVDDCSSDGSQAVIQDYAQRYPNLIRPFCHPQNLGIARNKAFAQQQAQGDWLTYLDGDDRYLPQKLERECETLRQYPDARIIFSDFYVINAKGKRLYTWAEKAIPPSGYVFPQVYSRNFPRNILFRNELVAYDCLKQVGFYDLSRKTHEDWDLKIRLTQHFPVAYCPAPLVEYRRHDRSITRSTDRALRLQEMIAVRQANRSRLNDLPPSERQHTDAALVQFFAQRASQIVQDTVREGQRGQAWRAYLTFVRWMSPGLALKTLLYLFRPSVPQP